MKKLYVLCPTLLNILSATLLLFSCFTSMAQITITESDMIKAGQVYYLAGDTAPTVTPGAAGANQTWDLTALKADEFGVQICVSPSSTPFASLFPTSNIAILDSTTKSSSSLAEYVYYNLNSGGIGQLGLALTGAYFLYSPAVIITPLPSTYRTTWGGTSSETQKEAFVLTGYDSLEIITGRQHADSVDGWGSVITPTGTYSALRAKFTNHEVYDSVFYHSTSTHTWQFIRAGTPDKTIDQSFYWITNGIGEPVVTMTLDSAGGKATSATFLQSNTTGVQEVSNNAKVQVYPNPASSSMNIMTATANEETFVTITDITGREMETKSLSNGRLQLNTSGYASGIYLYAVTDKNGSLLGRGKFCVGR